MSEWIVRDPGDLGRVIGSIRQEQGLRQAELAEQAGIHRSYLSALEQGRATEQTTRLFRVLRRLGVVVVIRSGGDR